jgi:hypothetical protein
VRVLLQIGIDKDPALPDVPFVLDLARTEAERQILTLWAAPNKTGRPYLAPPDVPAELVAVLRRAFDAMVADRRSAPTPRKPGSAPRGSAVRRSRRW